MNAEQIEASLRSLLKGKFSSLTLSFNDRAAPNYMTAKDADVAGMLDVDWVSEEEHQKAIANNSVWTLHWYPDTPIGFNVIGASSLTALLAGIEVDDAR